MDMKAPKKEVDCHTKAVIDALHRWETKGKGRNVFITGRADQLHKHMDNARLYLAGKYPVLSAHAMRQVTLGNGANGNGLGFSIQYMCSHDFVHGPERLKGLEAFVTVLDDAMLAHTLNHGQHAALTETINILNSRYGA
jgi:hypothetical protein